MHRSLRILDRAAAIVRANAVLMSAAFAISTDTRNQHTRKHDCAVTYQERWRAPVDLLTDVDDSNMASNLLTPSSAYRSSDTLSNAAIHIHERSCRDRYSHAGAVVTATRVAQRSPTTNHFFMALNFISTSITLIFNARCENQQTDSHSLANETLARLPLSDKSCSTCFKCQIR